MSFDEFRLQISRHTEFPLDRPHLIVTVEKTPFKSSCPVPASEIQHRREKFASVLAGIAEVTDPLGGFGGAGPYPLGDPSNPQTVVDCSPAEIFEILYFREEVVEDIGREIVRGLPAWTSESSRPAAC